MIGVQGEASCVEHKYCSIQQSQVSAVRKYLFQSKVFGFFDLRLIDGFFHKNTFKVGETTREKYYTHWRLWNKTVASIVQ